MGRIWRAIAAVCAACLLAACVGCAPSGSVTAGGAGDTEFSSYEAAVTLEGGSGKASVASPTALTVGDDGSLTATVVWSSSNYDLMVVDGKECLPVTTEPGSTFEIPVAALGEPLSVQARTTAMSEPHLIDYTLRFERAHDDAAEVSGPDGFEPDESQVAAGDSAGLPSVDIGNGWQPVKSVDLQYATQFAIDRFEGGFTLVRIADGQRFLLVPQGAGAPDGIADDVVVLQQPLGDVYLAASDAMCLFDALDAVDAVTVSGIARENWAVAAAVRAMDAGRIVYGGRYSMPDYDVLLAQGVRLAVESTMINHTPAVRDKLVELGIPVLTERSSYEADPLGRAEWIKLYGALLGEDEQAAHVFDGQVEKVRTVAGAKSGKTVAYFYINSNGAAVVRKPGDYVSRMIGLAGGEYVFDSLAQDGAATTVTMEMERFYAEAKDADIIIYNATIDEGVASLGDLLAKNGLLGDFKAVKSGDVWVTAQNMYQQMVNTGDIIADLNKALNGEDEGLTYLRKLDLSDLSK